MSNLFSFEYVVVLSFFLKKKGFWQSECVLTFVSFFEFLEINNNNAASVQFCLTHNNQKKHVGDFCFFL